ncbi:IclR family transcriptional regulator domain-containing protein [Microbaculum marinisediminis]|uniref:Helix-turn-helix domain-containing protein n=1 Tax=Microbaculum marinisediminis TaxID=2931392 RepID=A0AAW5R099_9HYPH|nr:IclR family transcriptional regulator C-terminal domain-containing protein [Microbaculum sp. A6E488]MCT8972088.1 helix-turn-helix domain-containing protein [Microbaculum sp. A6E488]
MAVRDETVQSLVRGIAVIRSFDAGHRHQTITDVAARTGLTRAAARRFLITLCETGLARSDGKHYELTPAILELAQSYVSSASELEIVQDVLRGLSEQFDESASAAMMDGTDIIYVARAPARHRIMTIGLGLGTRLPAHATSMGQALLSLMQPRELEIYLSKAKLTPLTPHTLTTRTALRQRIDEVQDRGYAIVSEELELGLRSISVPVRNRNARSNIAINISAQAARVSADDMVERFLPALQRAVRHIEIAMDSR